MTSADTVCYSKTLGESASAAREEKEKIIHSQDERLYVYRLREDDTVRIAYLETALFKNRSRMAPINIRLELKGGRN